MTEYLMTLTYTDPMQIISKIDNAMSIRQSFIEPPPHHSVLTLFMFLVLWCCLSLGRGDTGDALKAEYFKITYSHCVYQQWVFVIMSFTSKGSFSDQDWGQYKSMVINIHILEVVWTHAYLSKQNQ